MAEQAVIDAARVLLRSAAAVMGKPYTVMDRDYRALDLAITALDAERRATAMDAAPPPWAASRIQDLWAVAQAARTLIGTDEWPAMRSDEQTALQDAVNRLYWIGG